MVTAATRRVPGLAATLLAGMAQEHQRAAGAWQAEWETLTELLRLVGAAAAGTRTLLAGLRVDPARMRANLDRTGGLVMAESVATRLAPLLARAAAADLPGRAAADDPARAADLPGRAAAHDLLARAAREATAAGRPLRDVLADDPTIREHLPPPVLDAALDPAGYLGSAAGFVDRALAAHKETDPL